MSWSVRVLPVGVGEHQRRVAQHWRHARHTQPTDIETGCQCCSEAVVLGHPAVVVVVVVVVARTVGLKDCAQSGLGKAFLGSYLPSEIGQAKSNIRQKTRTSAFLMKEYVRFLTTEKLLIPRGYVLVRCVN